MASNVYLRLVHSILIAFGSDQRISKKVVLIIFQIMEQKNPIL